MPRRFYVRTLAAFPLIIASTSAWAEEANEADAAAPTEIIVTGRGESKIDVASAASEGSLAGVDLELRPLLRTGEILESVPGMIVTQHAGGGKANQYFLRGYNLDHGTDFLFEIDGVPINLRSHTHGQGYLDLNGLIHETVERIDYRKGPYRADVGDFGLVGVARAKTKDDLPGFAEAEIGSFGHYRFAAGGTAKLSETTNLVLVGDSRRYNSPFRLAERLRHYSGFAKLVSELPFGTFRASLSGYDSSWRPTDQIPERAIGTALLRDEFDTVDPSLRARTERYIANVGIDASRWRVNVYAQRYKLFLLSNFTYFLDDPVNGDQFEQSERRTTYGGRAETNQPLSDTLDILIGGEARIDDIPRIGLYSSALATRTDTRNEYSINERSAGLYGEIKWRPIEQLTVLAGLRTDFYRFKTVPLDGFSASVGSVNDSQVSPKISASFRPVDKIELYLNYGEGFHSNDARGVTQPVDPAPGLVRGKGYEGGARFEFGKVSVTATYWFARSESELVYVGDAGTVEPAGASKRRGYELTALWKPFPWLAIDGTFAANRARFRDAPGANRIPLAIERAGEFGFAAVFDKFNFSGRLRYLGPKPLIEDNSVRGDSTTVANFRSAWTPGRFEIFAELLNAFDSKDKDIQYFYTSRLPGEPLAGVDDIHSRAVESRMVRAGVKVKF